MGYPPWQTVYYHYRAWCVRTDLDTILNTLVSMRRYQLGQPPQPSLTVVDSQSVRLGLPHSESGVDGGKRVKGIKRHIVVEKNGYPLGANVTTANVHDTKGAEPLIDRILCLIPTIKQIKGDMGYKGAFKSLVIENTDLLIDCVKSNFGTSKFIPIDGRWVVERTFSWLQTYRRLMRNYEKYLESAWNVTMLACIFFMIRYF